MGVAAQHEQRRQGRVDKVGTASQNRVEYDRRKETRKGRWSAVGGRRRTRHSGRRRRRAALVLLLLLLFLLRRRGSGRRCRIAATVVVLPRGSGPTEVPWAAHTLTVPEGFHLFPVVTSGPVRWVTQFVTRAAWVAPAWYCIVRAAPTNIPFGDLIIERLCVIVGTQISTADFG